MGVSSLVDCPFILNQDAVIKELEKIELVHKEDYWFENVSNGFTLSHGENCILFEIKIEHKDKLKQLDALVSFRGFLGDRYNREIFFIPRHINKD
ncbi:hypothetical protein [Niabella hibiscisoli]|uniref:hypothetical protein n=1 Tax=Niabella hibiscisoli TaxID=1825928 RepID=UPI001F118EDB|nr:hypothetical protein [Niabella hibiscisoli]MCH5716699.1 hypothetical protein [Niabella hibiscisoli]